MKNAPSLPKDVEDKILEITSLNLTINQLLDLYGESFGDTALGQSNIQAALENFKSRQGELRKAICNTSFIKTIIDDKHANKATSLMAITIAEHLLKNNFCTINIAAMAVILAQYGLERFCKNGIEIC